LFWRIVEKPEQTDEGTKKQPQRGHESDMSVPSFLFGGERNLGLSKAKQESEGRSNKQDKPEAQPVFLKYGERGRAKRVKADYETTQAQRDTYDSRDQQRFGDNPE